MSGGSRVTDEIVPIRNCVLDMFVGECIGEGSYRRVYEVLHDPSLVMKVEWAGGSFHNITEWNIWKAVRDTPVADWFAPCVEIDSWGTVLFQKKVEIFTSEREFSAALHRTRAGVIPSMLADIRFNNFGMMDGRVVCVDYGINNVFERMSREMMIEAGFLSYDPIVPHDYTEEGQLHLDL